MDFKEELKNVLAELKAFKLSFSKKQLKFGSAMTTDGKTLEYEGDVLAEGMAVMMDGAPAPDGTYTLEDGTTCEVAAGAVTKITMPQNNEEQFSKIEERFAAIEAKFSEAETKLEEKLTAINKTITDALDKMTSGLEVVEKFSKATPTPAEPEMNRKTVKMNAEAETSKSIEAILKEINYQKQ